MHVPLKCLLKLTGKQNNGWYNLKMKPITIQQKLNRLVALQLVLAAQFVILFQVELMFIRQCV